MYSKSGLFIESHVDIVSSVEMESPEFPGEAKLLKGTMAGTAIGTTVGTFRGGALSFWAVLSWRDVTGAGAGLVEADFVAEPRFALAFRALAKDTFFTGAAEVAEFNLALPAATTAIFPQPLRPPGAATLVRFPSATRFFACCCAAAGPAALAPPALSAMAGRFAVAVVADEEEKRREEAAWLDIDARL